MILTTQIVHKIGLLQILHVNYTFILVTLKNTIFVWALNALFLCSFALFLPF